jgi:LPXTG-motif cell wall-anchored protein
MRYAYDDCNSVEQCVWRYDLAVANQSLDNFMSRAALTPAGRLSLTNSENTSLVTSLAIGAGLLAAIGLAFLFKRKKRAE